MSSKDYFERRESEERKAAERATDQRARKSHLDMAKAYRQAAESGQEPPEEDEGQAPTAAPDFRII